MGFLTTSIKSVRSVPSEIGPVIPVVDIAENIGYSRSSITNTITKNESTFKGFTLIKDLNTAGGMQAHLCLNRTGIERLLLLLRPAKNKGDLCERVEEFRAKAFGKMEENNELCLLPAPDNLKFDLLKATEYAEVCQKDPGIFHAAVFRKHGMPEFAEALRPAITHGETGWYNPTRLISLCNDPDLTPERLNWYLHNKGFQYREGYIWRLSDSGKIHGMEYNYEAPSGHREIRIRWRESILYTSGLKKSEAS
jgi:hypothetical protein